MTKESTKITFWGEFVEKIVMVLVLVSLLASCPMVLAAPYSSDTNTRHVEICIDLTQAWYNAFTVGDKPKADSIYKFLDKYNNHLVTDHAAIAIIQQAK